MMSKRVSIARVLSVIFTPTQRVHLPLLLTISTAVRRNSTAVEHFNSTAVRRFNSTVGRNTRPETAKNADDADDVQMNRRGLHLHKKWPFGAAFLNTADKADVCGRWTQEAKKGSHA
jgi:hypothetical protein